MKSQETKRAEAAFCDEMIGVVRREFYQRPADSKRFFRDRAFLMRAVTQPAAYLHKRGAMLPASKYRRILTTVIETIKAKGNRDEIEYFPRYLLHCVQQHMIHHGEAYYYAGKRFEGRDIPAAMVRSISARPVGDVMSEALKTTLAKAGADRTVEVLAEVHRALTTRGRIQKAKKTATEMELPGLCNGIAKRAD